MGTGTHFVALIFKTFSARLSRPSPPSNRDVWQFNRTRPDTKLYTVINPVDDLSFSDKSTLLTLAFRLLHWPSGTVTRLVLCPPRVGAEVKRLLQCDINIILAWGAVSEQQT